MIYESSDWKPPLIRAARWLERAQATDRAQTRVLARVEREIFVGFYVIRKILETFNVSSSTRVLTWKLTCYKPQKGVTVDHLNRGDILKTYELDSPLSENRDLGFICNQVIHSYVFEPAMGEADTLAGVFITSDKNRSKRLYFFPTSLIIDLFRTVGSDYPSTLRLVRDPKTRQWKGSAS